MTKITNTRQIVLDVINQYPYLANNDMLLFAAIWNKTWDNNKKLSENLLNQIHPETITRRRRELYQMGLIKYTTQSLKEREDAFKKELEAHHTPQAVSWLNDED